MLRTVVRTGTMCVPSLSGSSFATQESSSIQRRSATYSSATYREWIGLGGRITASRKRSLGIWTCEQVDGWTNVRWQQSGESAASAGTSIPPPGWGTPIYERAPNLTRALISQFDRLMGRWCRRRRPPPLVAIYMTSRPQSQWHSNFAVRAAPPGSAVDAPS